MRTDSIAALEAQSATLQRNLEMVRRRGHVYREIDRAGYLLLRTIDANGPGDISSLSDVLGLDSSTLGRQVGDAETKGLLQRTQGPDDRRRRVVSLTDAGRAAMNAVRERRRTSTAEALADWSDADVETLSEMLARYNAAIFRRYRITADQSLSP
jgi:DNA-binding MarR family transcriptional regulator